MLRKLQNHKGFSLVELLVALVILVIVITGITTLLLGGFSGVFRTGRKTQALKAAQTDIENALRVDNPDNDDPLVIYFDGVSPITLKGKIKTATENYEEHSVSINVFLPQK